MDIPFQKLPTPKYKDKIQQKKKKRAIILVKTIDQLLSKEFLIDYFKN